jgi:hypothetical protein
MTKTVILMILLSSAPADDWSNFERGRRDYSDGRADPRWVFCRIRSTPTDRGDCIDRPWRKPQ